MNYFQVVEFWHGGILKEEGHLWIFRAIAYSAFRLFLCLLSGHHDVSCSTISECL